MFDAGLFPAVPGQVYPDNQSNRLYQTMVDRYAGIRDINQVSGILSQIGTGFNSGKDYEKLENARLLDPSEYILNEKLGYISLNAALNADEVLAVAYEYTVRGEIHTVGELTSNAPAAPSTLVVKMLRSTTQSPKMPTWDLMMKNVYNIGSYNLSAEDFVLDVLYQNDKAGTMVNYLRPEISIIRFIVCDESRPAEYPVGRDSGRAFRLYRGDNGLFQ